jgi:hypothetical protein
MGLLRRRRLILGVTVINYLWSNSPNFGYSEYIVLHEKYMFFLSYFNKTWISRDFKKYSNNKFHENTSSTSRVVACGRTKDRHEESSVLERRTKLGATKRIKVMDVQKVALGFEQNKTLKWRFSQNVPLHILLVPLSRHERRLPGKLFRRVVIRYETRLLCYNSLSPHLTAPVIFLRTLPKVEDDAEILQQGGGRSHYSNTVFMHWIPSIWFGGQKGETQALSLPTSEGLKAQHFVVYWICIYCNTQSFSPLTYYVMSS